MRFHAIVILSLLIGLWTTQTSARWAGKKTFGIEDQPQSIDCSVVPIREREKFIRCSLADQAQRVTFGEPKLSPIWSFLVNMSARIVDCRTVPLRELERFPDCLKPTDDRASREQLIKSLDDSFGQLQRRRIVLLDREVTIEAQEDDAPGPALIEQLARKRQLLDELLKHRERADLMQRYIEAVHKGDWKPDVATLRFAVARAEATLHHLDRRHAGLPPFTLDTDTLVLVTERADGPHSERYVFLPDGSFVFVDAAELVPLD